MTWRQIPCNCGFPDCYVWELDIRPRRRRLWLELLAWCVAAALAGALFCAILIVGGT